MGQLSFLNDLKEFGHFKMKPDDYNQYKNNSKYVIVSKKTGIAFAWVPSNKKEKEIIELIENVREYAINCNDTYLMFKKVHRCWSDISDLLGRDRNPWFDFTMMEKSKFWKEL